MRIPSEYGPSLLVLAAAGAVLLGGPLMVQELGFRNELKRVELASARLDVDGGILAEMNQAFRDLAVAVEPSVVHIAARTVRPGNATALSTGSGWIYDGDGHIVTNHHVVASADMIEVQLSDGRLRDARLVGSDPLTDIAVLEVAPDRIIPARRAGMHERVEQGDLVFAFGSPFDFRFSMSQGVVSGRDRYAGVIDTGTRRGLENFIQVDAAINPGNSGGPLTDHLGRVIGMNTAIATAGNRTGADDNGRFAGIGLAIPLEMIEPVVGQIIEKGFAEQGFLGVTLRDLTSGRRADLGWDSDAVMVTSVQSGSAADEAGLEPDDLIVAIDGDRVPTQRELIARIGSAPPGTRLELDVVRPDPDTGGLTELTIPVTLGLLDTLLVHGRLPAGQPIDAIEALGIGAMERSTPERSAELGLPYVPGVIVTRWTPTTGAIRLRLGWPPPLTIFSVNGRDIDGPEAMLAALSDGDATLARGERGAPIRVLLRDAETGEPQTSIIYLKDVRPGRRP